MLTNTADELIYKMTKQTISSLKSSDGLEDVNIILLESNHNSDYIYDVNHYIKPDTPFNYNAYLNMGIEYANSEYTCVSNNDIIFSKDWWSKLRNSIEKYSLDVASPKSTAPLQPHNNQKEYFKHMYTPDSITKLELKRYSFAGWCFTFTEEVREWLFPLDEQFSHYHQDIDLIMVLKQKDIKHGFVAGSKVEHLGNKSSAFIEGGKMQNLLSTKRALEKKWAGYDMSFMEIEQ
jgi:GT2 family glycosyltransferase